MGYIYKVTLIIESEESPSTVFDLAIESGEKLAEDVNGTTDSDDACVQSMSQSDYNKLRS
jgi:hypothetical protein